jgi:hypothetical protein
MVSNESFRKLALALPETEEHPHFERRAFKVRGRRIFATLHEKSQSANFMFTPELQSTFIEYDPQIISRIPNKWGLKGATTMDLKKASKELVSAALEAAYDEMIKKKA